MGYNTVGSAILHGQYLTCVTSRNRDVRCMHIAQPYCTAQYDISSDAIGSDTVEQHVTDHRIRYRH
jgi:hypothetical protein